MLLGVRLVTKVKLVGLVEPDDEGKHGWMAKVEPETEFLKTYEFRFLVVAAGRKVSNNDF
jgi:cation diffusion facilitator CzcD-associated flavoprotein CzcO